MGCFASFEQQTLSSLRHTTGDATAVGRCRVARLIPHKKEGYDHHGGSSKIGFERPSERRERDQRANRVGGKFACQLSILKLLTVQ